MNNNDSQQNLSWTYRQKILDYIHWTYKDRYYKIMSHFINKKLTGSEFENQFCTLYQSVEKEGEKILTDTKKIEFLKLNKKSDNFRAGLYDIFLDLDIFLDEQNLDSKQKIGSYNKDTAQLRQLVQEVMEDFKSYE
uniref:hypothetical protein n=1 Tax=Nitzschia ovalis TaxID=908985 RepID=UPI001EF9E6E0|nr:hypothetical protein MKT70_pgp097 [Nitzschia ovalis]YP_010282995.1 hypothetical protein MKT70_pgp040 [Nitzschia ovalis]ULD15702.1 hypothetical protein [Nitzschia ovalis]ULD15759.1 hypothetical protein [Nitzschia ovalis]